MATITRLLLTEARVSGVLKTWSRGVMGVVGLRVESLREKKKGESVSVGVAHAGEVRKGESAGGGMGTWHCRVGILRARRRRDIEGGMTPFSSGTSGVLGVIMMRRGRGGVGSAGLTSGLAACPVRDR